MAFYESLNIRKDEIAQVTILVLQSFFLGVFLGAFDVSANTLFLNSFNQSMIPRAIVISGITGIILTSLYSTLQAKLRFSTLAILNLTTVFVLTFLLRVGYLFSDTKWLAFALFVLMGPLNIIALVGFWGTTGRMFDLRQGKRIFGFIDTGGVIGLIVSSFSIPFLITVGMPTKDLLYISAVSVFLAVIFQIVITYKHPENLKVKVTKETKRSSFIDSFRIPYVRTMALFVVLSMLIAFFVHYLFLATASERFDSADELAKFFGGLMGALTFVSVLIKTFVYNPLMKTYGLKISLLVSPIVMAIVTISAALVGSFFGFTAESATFTFFFLLISLSRFFQKALKDSIESPVLKLLYQSLKPSIRHEVQARVDGTINETAALASGVILSLLGLLGFITIIHYTYILLGFIVIWFFVSIRLFHGYQNTLKETLQEASAKEEIKDEAEEWLKSLGHLEVEERLNLINSSKPWLIPGMLTSCVLQTTGSDLTMVCNLIRQRTIIESIPELKDIAKNTSNSDDKQQLTDTISYLEDISKESKNSKLIEELIESKNYEDRVRAARLISASSNLKTKVKLTFLLRDLVPSVKKQAIWAARGVRSKETISFLIDFLDKDNYAPLAHAALIDTGEIGLEMLVLAFNRTAISDVMKRRIVRIMPDTGSVIAGSTLFGMLSIQSNLKTEVLNGLLQLNYVTDARENIMLHPMLIEQSGICAWNLNALFQCPPDTKAPKLRGELEHEFAESRHNLFQLLKLQYDKSSIEAVVENLNIGTNESISFAIELLDTFIIEAIKPYIVPLLEDTSLNNKIWALQNYFPLREYSNEELLKAIINRNENLIGKQTKIYAMNSFRNLEELSVSADLVAQLFNTDKILRQLSAELIQRIDQPQYNNYRRRLNDRLRVELDRNLETSGLTGRRAFERLEFFKGLNYCSKHTAPLFWLYNSNAMKLPQTNLLSLRLFSNKTHIILVEQGRLSLRSPEGHSKPIDPGQICITEGLIEKGYSLVASEGTIIHYMDFEMYKRDIYTYNYLTDYLK